MTTSQTKRAHSKRAANSRSLIGSWSGSALFRSETTLVAPPTPPCSSSHIKQSTFYGVF